MLVEVEQESPRVERDHRNRVHFFFTDNDFALVNMSTGVVNKWRQKILDNENFEIRLNDNTTRYIVNVNNLSYMKATKEYK